MNLVSSNSNLEVSFLVALNNEFRNVSGYDVTWTMGPWWVLVMWPFLHRESSSKWSHDAVKQTSLFMKVEFDGDWYTSALIYHLLSLSLWGAESKDIRPYSSPLDGFPLRLERTSSILTKASSSVFITYLAGRILVCTTQRTEKRLES